MRSPAYVDDRVTVYLPLIEARLRKPMQVGLDLGM